MTYNGYDLTRNDKNLDGKIIWACAYTTSNTEKHMSLKCKPVKGMIKKNEYNFYFHEFNKKGEPKKQSVSIYSRSYADTEEECTELYNSLVQSQINFLQELADNCKEDLIKAEG